MLALTLVAFIFATQYGDSQMQRIEKQGIVHVVTRENARSHFTGVATPDDLENKLASLFGEYLKLPIRFQSADNLPDIIDALYDDSADFAAAGLTADAIRSRPLRYGYPFQNVTEQVVYRSGETSAKNWEDLQNANIVVPADSSYIQTLETLKGKYPDMHYEVRAVNTFDLLDAVIAGTIDYTIADSIELDQYRRLHPNLSVGFEVVGEKNIAWAFKPMTRYPGLYNLLETFKIVPFLESTLVNAQNGLPQDHSFIKESEKFFAKIEKSGELDWLIDTYVSYLEDFDFLDSRTFNRRIQTFLPLYRDMFKRAAHPDLDWMLLAALAYQESHWNINARSPTGVRGIMMLTENTARSQGVTNRLDPMQSIHGGARYYRSIYEKLPEVHEPDRTWITLASYNIGPSRIAKIREIIKTQGKDPNVWQNIRDALPQHTGKASYRKGKLKNSRGHEAIQYVENIRVYYEVLQTVMAGKD